MMLLLTFVGWSLVGICASETSDDGVLGRRRLQVRAKRRGRGADCVKWGRQFDVPLQSKNIDRSCKTFNGYPVCCEAVDDSRDGSGRGVGIGLLPATPVALEEDCEIKYVYRSSPFEVAMYDESVRISKLGDEVDHEASQKANDVDDGTKLPTAVHESRRGALMRYLFSKQFRNNATASLERIKVRMQSVDEPEPTQEDYELLSRFLYRKVCGGKVVKRWIEWIEPVFITHRHPYAYSRCRKTAAAFDDAGMPVTGRSNVDYVLLRSGGAMKLEEDTYGAIPSSPRKHLFLDAGTSTFESSLFWFTCAYSQRRISFDDVYGWEYTLLEPKDYWSRVPPKWLPYWHFYNAPISNNESDSMSPVMFLKKSVTPQDFVSFKLDIDNPAVEMPIALQLLSDDSFAARVDEFFFELHYRCEFMTSCGWGKTVPLEQNGLFLERATVSKYFIDLRKRGIRAHPWP